MRLILPLLSLLLTRSALAQDGSIAARYRDPAARIIAAATRDSAAWAKLARLSDTFGPRFSGTENLELAIDWVLAEMKRDGLENVRGEPVMVPRWVRGAESAELVSPRSQRLPLLGLGGSIGTPAQGITAELLIVKSFDDLKARAAEARGKIILYDVPFTTYGATVQYRGTGAIEAAKASSKCP
jgi:carboxypeptidase Q